MKNLRSILPPMDTLATFEAAARLQSFTRAAGELHLTQAAVSRQIRLLEENLGTPLFHRAHRAVSLTPMGKSFQSTVALALAHIANAAVEHRGTTPKTHLNLGHADNRFMPTMLTKSLINQRSMLKLSA